MNTLQNIMKNTSVLFTAQIVNYVLGFFFIIYTARYLGAEGFGILSFALAFTGIFQILADLGFSKLLTREISRNKSLTNKYIGNIISIKLITSFLTFALIIITINLMGYSTQIISIVYLIALYTILTTFTQIFYAVLQAYEIMEYQSVGIIVNAFLLLFGALYLIYRGYSIIGFGFLYLITSLIILISNFIIYLWKFTLPKLEIDLNFWKSQAKESLPFAITGISLNLYYWIDTILLSLLIGEAAVGWYNAAYKLVIVLLVIPITLNTVIFPLMSQFHVSSKESLKISFEKLLKLMIFIAIPLGVGTTFLADKTIILIYGDQFFNAIIALQILIWSLVLTFIRSPFERLLESTNKQFTVTKIFIIGVIFNIIANILIIPEYSYVGAGIVTVLTDILILFLLFKSTKSDEFFTSNKLIIDTIKIALASIIMGIMLSFMIKLNIFIIIIISIIIYLFISIILKIINQNEITMIKSIFNK